MCPVAKCGVVHFMMFDLSRLIGLCSIEYHKYNISIN